MRKLGWLLVVAILMAACGGGDDSSSDSPSETTGAATSQGLDPCTLAPDDVLIAYFGEVFAGEPSEAGPIDSCRWRGASANSLLIQTASGFPLNRPDPCEGCVELSFADDGYAAESPLQSSATFVSGSSWYSVTTTGFGDDAASISALAETIFENANA